MIIRTIEEISGTERDVKATDGSWTSKRLLLKKDRFGFSLHESTVHAGREVTVWYKNHLEAVYIFKGEGELENTANDQIFPLRPGTLYALYKEDRVTIRAKTEMVMVSVFNPPVAGDERHAEDGSYPLIED